MSKIVHVFFELNKSQLFFYETSTKTIIIKTRLRTERALIPAVVLSQTHFVELNGAAKHIWRQLAAFALHDGHAWPGTHSALCPSSAEKCLIQLNHQLSNLRSITMKTLIIKDLARSEQLDRGAMAAVRGGWKMPTPGYTFGDVTYAPTYDSSVHATQDLAQMQSVVNATANGSAFLNGIDVKNNTSQFGQNNVVVA
jgi:hypothetical protein